MSNSVFDKQILMKIKNSAKRYVQETEFRAQSGTTQLICANILPGHKFQSKEKISGAELKQLVQFLENKKQRQTQLATNRISNYNKQISLFRLLKHLKRERATLFQ